MSYISSINSPYNTGNGSTDIIFVNIQNNQQGVNTQTDTFSQSYLIDAGGLSQLTTGTTYLATCTFQVGNGTTIAGDIDFTAGQMYFQYEDGASTDGRAVYMPQFSIDTGAVGGGSSFTFSFLFNVPVGTLEFMEVNGSIWSTSQPAGDLFIQGYLTFIPLP